MREVPEARKIIVLADTNFLLLPANLKINIIAELDRIIEGAYELVVPSFCLEELNKLRKRGRVLERAVNLAMAIIERHAKVLHAPLRKEEKVDEAIAKLAENLGAIVATCDSELRRILRERGIPVIYPRASKKLELEGAY